MGKCLCHNRLVAITEPTFCPLATMTAQSNYNSSLLLAFSAAKPFFSKPIGQNSGTWPKVDAKADRKEV